MKSKNWEDEKAEVLAAIAKYIDIEVVPFGKPTHSVLEVEKRNPMYGGTGVVYMLSLFEAGELANNRIGVYMVLMNKGDQAGFHEHGTKKEQELYVVLSGEGEYVEQESKDNEMRILNLKKGNVTAIQGNHYHSVTNTSNKPLIIFVLATYEKV